MYGTGLLVSFAVRCDPTEILDGNCHSVTSDFQVCPAQAIPGG